MRQRFRLGPYATSARAGGSTVSKIHDTAYYQPPTVLTKPPPTSSRDYTHRNAPSLGDSPAFHTLFYSKSMTSCHSRTSLPQRQNTTDAPSPHSTTPPLLHSMPPPPPPPAAATGPRAVRRSTTQLPGSTTLRTRTLHRQHPHTEHTHTPTPTCAKSERTKARPGSARSINGGGEGGREGWGRGGE